VARATGRAEHQPVRVTNALKKGPRATSAEPAETSRRRETSAALPDEPGASSSAGQACAEANQSSEEVPEGQARADGAKHWVYARYERRSEKEFEEGRVRQAGLTQKLPSPALKEAERSGSYNPSTLNTLSGGTVRHGTVQGHRGISEAYADLRRIHTG